MFSKGFKSKVFVHGNVLKDSTKGMLSEFRHALENGDMQFRLTETTELPEQRMFKVDNTFLAVEDSLNPLETNNATVVTFQKGPSSDTDKALMDAMSS